MVTLAEIATDPSRAKEAPAEAIPALMAQCAAIQAALAARLAEAANGGGTAAKNDLPGGDGWLTVEEAAELSSLGVRWLYRHWETIPGAKKFSPRRLRFREGPFRRWLQKGA